MDPGVRLVAFRGFLAAVAGTAIGLLLTPPYLWLRWSFGGFGLVLVGVASGFALRRSFEVHGAPGTPGTSVAVASWLVVFCPALPVLFVVWPQLFVAWVALIVAAIAAVVAAGSDRDFGSIAVAIVLTLTAVTAPITYTDLFLAGVELRVRAAAPHYETAIDALRNGDIDRDGAGLPASSPVESDPLRVGWIWHGGILDNVAGPVWAEDVLTDDEQRQLFPSGPDAGLYGDCQALFGHWYFCVFT